MFLIRFIGVLTLLLLADRSFGLDLQTRSHSMCGVEKYRSLPYDSRCPVAEYIGKASPACNPIYNTKQDYKICGFDPIRKQKRCERIPGSRAPIVVVGRDPDLGCAAGYKEVESPVPASCANPAFGTKGYEFCQDPSHGVASYQTCAREEFGVESYRTCSFYKTPEELAAYVQATNESIVTYQDLLPARQGELFSRMNSEGAFACLIRKYSTEPMYEIVVEDLEKKFLLVFGYESKDAIIDCANESEASTKIKFTVGNIDCDAINKDAIATLIKPESTSDSLFARFKQNCTMKKSYDGLVEWFETKRAEVIQLEGDLAARSDPNIQVQLQNLKTKLGNK